MKIKEITYDHILFDTGDCITFEHYQDCCENVYADFEQLDDIARNYDFKELLFESVSNHGFLLGDKKRSFFIPCYNEQNGYYDGNISILLNGKTVLSEFPAKFIDDWE